MLRHDVPVEQAKKQLSIKYFHLNFTQTGILDYILWRYQQRNKENTIGFRDWIANEYDHAQIAIEFAQLSFWKRLRL